MRRIGYREWIQNVQQGSRLSRDEQQELLSYIGAQADGPKTWEEYERIAVRLGEFTAKANNCQCLADVRMQYHLVVGNFHTASNGNLALLQDVSHPSHKEHWKLNTILARKLARKRKCHGLMRGFVCYCDEHNH